MGDSYQPPDFARGGQEADDGGEGVEPIPAYHGSDPTGGHTMPDTYRADRAEPALLAAQPYPHPSGAQGRDADAYPTSTPIPVASAIPPDDEVQSMIATIQSFSYVPMACAAGAAGMVLCVFWALNGSAWKAGINDSEVIYVGLSNAWFFHPFEAKADVRITEISLAEACSREAKAACSLRKAGLAARVFLTFGLLGGVAVMVVSFVLVSLDANRLAPLRARLGYGGISTLPRLTAIAWCVSAVSVGLAAFAYASTAPFIYRKTTLQLEASFGLVRLALLLAVVAGGVHTVYLQRVRPMVISGAFAAASDPGALAERPLEVEFGLEAVRAYRLLRDKSQSLLLMLVAQLGMQTVCTIMEPQWSALLVFAGGAAVAYQWHHLASFYVAATAVSVAMDVVDLVGGTPLQVMSHGYGLVWTAGLFAFCLKMGNAVLVAHLDGRSGAGYSEYLMSSD